MKFVREPIEDAIETVAKHIAAELSKDQRVLWLVCGGSSIAAEAAIMQRLHDIVGDKLTHLAVILTDERYGPNGHADSNAEQLREAGFDPTPGVFVDILTHNAPLAETVSFYNDVATTAFVNAGTTIAVFGMGANAHIAGLQPGSPAVADDAADAVGFSWSDFTRLTLTANLLRQVDVAYALVYGDGKREALERLQTDTETYAELPAKLLYELPEAYVYNDQLIIRSKR